ncbi:hypothetical protein E4T49_07916 [Aureobasidium sp. EXF-10728]|nr:hypothetical protein E4T49_07916 [Aureobasidium sp. EXF-10728]
MTSSTTKSSHEKPAFPVTANNLESLLEYSSHSSGHGLISLVSLPAGALFAPITAYTPSPTPQWHTLQTSASTHISLDSAFTYLNHSCVPTLEIDTEKMEVRVSRHRALEKGDGLSFFYPSTEWEMDRSFECLCGEKEKCVGEVKGAKEMERKSLEGWWVNGFIWKLKDEQEKVSM